jgi:hypothetical protein
MRIRAKGTLAGCLSVSAWVMGGAALAGPGDHRFEAGLSYERRTFDTIVFPDLPGFPGSGGSFDPPDSETWRASGRFYFQDVKTDDVPLAEAAYLGRNSSATLSWARFASNFGHLDLQQLDFELYVPKSIFYVAGGIARFENAAFVNSSGVITDHDTDWVAIAGITPFDGLRITTSYGHDVGYDPNVSVKYVGRLGGSRFYGFGLRGVDPDAGDFSLSGDFDFFFDPTLSVGAGYDERDDRWTLRAEKFFTPRLGVQASYADADGSELVRLQAAWRF